jgi:hypothetical protein
MLAAPTVTAAAAGTSAGNRELAGLPLTVPSLASIL